MSPRLSFGPQVADDLAEGIDWYAGQRPGLEVAFRQDFEEIDRAQSVPIPNHRAGNPSRIAAPFSLLCVVHRVWRRIADCRLPARPSKSCLAQKILTVPHDLSRP